MDTIFAVSSGSPPAAIAVLRISGPDAFSAAEAMAGSLGAPRVAVLRALHDPRDGALLDRALVLAFAEGRSATGEPLVELHLHGGRAVVAAVAGALVAMPGLRQAEAGEFTRRALIAGRIDLSEAEGLGDLLTAETEAQRRAAIGSAEGAVRRAVEGWGERLLVLAARVEAELDFSDEDDVAAADDGALRREIAALAHDIETVLANPPVERLRDGIRVTIAGPPNSGKSTLLNRLAERDAAIVSPIAGTTRDRIEIPLVQGGIAYVFSDTAGLAEATDDPIERIGIGRAEQAMAEADIVLWLGDSPPPRADAVWVHARADVPERQSLPAGRRVAISAASGEGIGALWHLLAEASASLLPRLDQLALNARQRDLIAVCAGALRAAEGESDMLLVAENMRLSRLQLDRVTGRADVEAVLDTLFGRFCIGK